ncbi:hypothetical protein L6164_014593 [Bauhinia variegata]|uniref:Uncharacterized protein n=1 Tax=Bauhinia variegata TaxID=167791 RepID=A0ACB9NI31_BAUVA|nr:hypothetical protein L6164_014593 [Bauhinia variegata]
MESFKFLKGYGKVDGDHLEDQPLQHQQRRVSHKTLVATISIFGILFLTLIVGMMLGALITDSETESPRTQTPSNSANSVDSIKTVCNVTRFPASCVSTLSSSLNPSIPNDPEAIFKLSLQVSIAELSKLSSFFKNTNGSALADCKDQIDDALSRLSDSVSAMEAGEKALTDAKINDIQTWISAAVTDQESCLDGLEEMESNAIGEVKSKMKNCREYTSNSLAIIAHIRPLLDQFHMSLH